MIAVKGRPPSASAVQRQFAVAVDGATIRFECAHGHSYKINYSKKPLARRMGAEGCRLMARWWSRERGGCSGECPKCIRGNK